jgi:hypothetical protein
VNASMTDIVAYQQGTTTTAPTLIMPGDMNGGTGGRDIVNTSGIVVRIARFAPGARDRDIITEEAVFHAGGRKREVGRR